jgi:hypothetical protein
MAHTTTSTAQRSGSLRLSAAAASAAGVGAFAYAVAFLLLRNLGLSAGILLVNGLLTIAALVAVYARLRPVDPDLATLGLVLGIVGGVGAAVHGGFDLAVALHPVGALPADAANPVDPRGLLTFAVTGLGLLVLGRLIARGGPFPHAIGHLATIAGMVLVLLYLARLVVLNPADPLVLGPALLSGFIVNPALYTALGIYLFRFSRA